MCVCVCVQERGIDGAPVADVGTYQVHTHTHTHTHTQAPPHTHTSTPLSLERKAVSRFLAYASPCVRVCACVCVQGSWTTFVSKVMSGQLEELAGGPLFLAAGRVRQEVRIRLQAHVRTQVCVRL